MSTTPKTKKIYCYVDETGQDTKGQFFLVAVVILGEEREQFRRDLEEIELKSGKRSKKWSHTTPRQRESYLRSLFNRPDLMNTLYYCVPKDPRRHDYILGDHPKPATHDHLKTGQRIDLHPGR